MTANRGIIIIGDRGMSKINLLSLMAAMDHKGFSVIGVDIESDITRSLEDITDIDKIMSKLAFNEFAVSLRRGYADIPEEEPQLVTRQPKYYERFNKKSRKSHW